jgi:hypothetical protein
VAACVVAELAGGLAPVVDAVGQRRLCARRLDVGEDASRVEERMESRAIKIFPNNLSRVVDASVPRDGCAWHGIGRDAAASVEKTSGPEESPPTICPKSLMPREPLADWRWE